jgi:hypothetical protein
MKTTNQQNQEFSSKFKLVFVIVLYISVTVAALIQYQDVLFGVDQKEVHCEEISAPANEIDTQMIHLLIELAQGGILNDTLSVHNMYKLLHKCGAYYPEYIIAQYILESGHGTSRIAKQNNNLFGMKKAYQRNTCRIKERHDGVYAKYDNWQLSVLDRVLWEAHAFKNHGGVPSVKEYRDYLARNYAEDKQYIKKLGTIMSNNFNK